MQPRPTRTGRTGRPPRLSQQAIISGAQRLLAEEGADSLSMRRLARELDSTPMALYHHVRDKDELLVLMLEAHAQGIRRPELPEDPRERMIAAGQLLHSVLADCPWIVEVLASDDLMAISALWMVEVMVDAAIACGLTPEQAVDAYRTVWYYTVGELMIRVSRERRQGESDQPSHRDQAFARLSSEDYPRLASLAGQWAGLTARDTHRQGLEAVVNGLIAGV
ncbi:helix-turn-helix domain-containing protein [Streptomyces sp. NPDC029721]|uniref:TetR/AcrR family transcriptional regulator n=1 Tax=Streptomyces sp. NPDC029721 TaxID=3157090 RepID=UPI0033E113AD